MATTKTAVNPADQESTPSALDKMLRDFFLNVDDCLPAIILSYDRVSNVATVKPLIPRVRIDDTIVERNEVIEVQVLSIGGGGFNLNFPMAQGDLGWIKATDRDLDNFKKTLAEAAPATCRTHTFSDSMFFPDVMRNYVVVGEHSGEAVFQSVDGSNRVAIGTDRIKIAVGSTYIELIAGKIKMVTGGLLEVVSGESTFSGNVTIVGATVMQGGFTATGGAESSSVDNLKVAGTAVGAHDHSNPEGGRTGPFGS
jgi:Phage protein Gp138 N-terminal domain